VRRLFGTAGIRGEYGKVVSPEIAYKVGLAMATFIGGKGTVSVGYDVRLTSPLLSSSVASGLMAGGVDVVNIGLVPTPVLAFTAPHLGLDGGVMITASHNPPPDNGIKCFDSKGMEFTEKMEEELEDIIFNEKFTYAKWDGVGDLEYYPEVVDEYVDKLLSKFKPKKIRRKIKVIVDCANGAASNITPLILRKLGASVLSINCHFDGLFPGRTPEPRPDVLEGLGRIAKTAGVDVAFAHDGDADRLSALTSDGRFVLNDRLIAYYAKVKLLEKGGGVVIVSIDTSFAIDEVVEKYGGEIVRTKLGKTHEKLVEYGSKAVMSAEPWKLIDPDWGYWVDGIYQAALLTSLMLEKGVTIEELLKDIPEYPQVRVSFKVPNEIKHKIVNEVHEKMREIFKNYESELTIDGLRLNMPDKSWVLVRASGTEPKIRIYAEARTSKRLNEIYEKTLKILREVAGKYGVKIS